MQNLARELEEVLNGFENEDEKRRACRAILDAVGRVLKLEMKVCYEPFGPSEGCAPSFPRRWN